MLHRIAITLTAIIALSATMVLAQPQEPPACGDRVGVAMALRAQFGERQMGVLTLASGLELVLLANPQTGSWTMLSSVPGHSVVCLSGSGIALPPPAEIEAPSPEDDPI